MLRDSDCFHPKQHYHFGDENIKESTKNQLLILVNTILDNYAL